MKHNSTFLAIALLSLLLTCLAACKQSYKEVAFVHERIEERGGPCLSDTSSCMEITLSYVVLTPTDDTAFSKINTRINEALQASLTFEHDHEHDYSLEQLAAHSVIEFADLLEEYPEQNSRWSQEASMNILLNNGRILCSQIDEYAYLGGAHPNDYTTLMTFDLFTGEQIDVFSLVENHTAFLAMAERVFREQRSIGPEEDFNEAGFFWDRQFTLSEQMGITNDGFLLFYNNYEVAPYVAGPTSFVLEWDRITDFLKPEVLKKFHLPPDPDVSRPSGK